MREALFAQDGWGSENVDQDTQWDVPASPEPSGKTDPNSATSGPTAGIPMWKTNTGTELWEANLRNGGQLPQQQPPVQKTPWGPANNYGGTWGEDDEANEPGNVWNGASSAMGGGAGPGGPGGLRDQPPGVGLGGPGPGQQAAPGQQQPGQQPGPWNAGGGGGSGPGAGGMWGTGGPGAMGPNVAGQGIKKENEWGGGAGAGAGGGNAWGGAGADVRNPAVAAGGGLDPTGIDMRNMRIASAMDSNREIRGDPRGISGRLNGNVGLWDQHQMASMQQKMPPTGATTPGTPTGAGAGVGGGNGGGAGQWPSNPLAGSVVNNGGVGVGGGKLGGSGWDDPTAGGGPPPVVRRKNMDDGTALWGANALQRQTSANVSGWKDNGPGGVDGGGGGGGMGRNPLHRNNSMGGGPVGNMPGNQGGLVGRMGGGAGGGAGGPMKPESLWGQNPAAAAAAALGVGRGGGGGNWGADDLSAGGGGQWGDDKPGGVGGGMGGNSLWNDASGGNGNSWAGGKPKMPSVSSTGWNDGGVGGGAPDMGNSSDWGMPPQNKLPPNGGGGNKMNPQEYIRASKQYHHLCELGFKKEDVEMMLRATNMNMDESLEALHRGSGNEWPLRRPVDNHGGFGGGQDQFLGAGAGGGGGGGGGGVSGRFAAAAAGVGPMGFQQVSERELHPSGK